MTVPPLALGLEGVDPRRLDSCQRKGITRSLSAGREDTLASPCAIRAQGLPKDSGFRPPRSTRERPRKLSRISPVPTIADMM